MDLKAIGRRLKILRAGSTLKAKEVAKHVKVSPQHLSYVETGSRAPSPQLLERLADLYDVTVPFLKYGDEEKQAQEEAREAFLSSDAGQGLSPIERQWVEDWNIPVGRVPDASGFLAYVDVVRQLGDTQHATNAASLAKLLSSKN